MFHLLIDLPKDIDSFPLISKSMDFMLIFVYLHYQPFACSIKHKCYIVTFMLERSYHCATEFLSVTYFTKPCL